MHTVRLRRPSPAFVISVTALFVALGGTTYAATSLPANSVGAKQLKKNAVTSAKIKKGAVSAAKINTAGLVVPSAVHSNNATAANHASTADHATNSDQLGGAAASAFQQRVNGTCSTAVVAINQNGSVGCSSRTVVPIDVALTNGPMHLTEIDVGNLRFAIVCDGPPSVVFFNNAATQATLNWFYNDGASNALGTAISSKNSQEFGFQSKRIEGQFIYSVHNQEEITVNLHAIDLVGSCEATGTIEYAPE